MATHPDGKENVAVVELKGILDMPAAQSFEQQTLDLLDGGARFFVIGFEQVELLTSAGIRVLLALRSKLKVHSGALVLYGLNERVKTVLSVTRLLDVIQIFPSKDDAMVEIAARRASHAASRRSLSSLTRLVGQVLGSATHQSAAGPPLASGASHGLKSALTAEVARLMQEAGPDRPT